jgi:hypothetical protein
MLIRFTFVLNVKEIKQRHLQRHRQGQRPRRRLRRRLRRRHRGLVDDVGNSRGHHRHRTIKIDAINKLKDMFISTTKPKTLPNNLYRH